MELKLNYLNIFKKLYSSEKTNFFFNKNKTLVFKTKSNINKIEILLVIEKFLKLKVKKIRTLWIKGKKKNKKNGVISYSKKWKKIYVILKENQNIKLNNLFQ